MPLIIALLSLNVLISSVALWRSLSIAARVRTFVGEAAVNSYVHGRDHGERAKVIPLRQRVK